MVITFSSDMFDLGQIEVLQDPQALFYGKQPGGVISMRTTDSTDEFEFITRAGDEFEGDESRGELIVRCHMGAAPGTNTFVESVERIGTSNRRPCGLDQHRTGMARSLFGDAAVPGGAISRLVHLTRIGDDDAANEGRDRLHHRLGVPVPSTTI